MPVITPASGRLLRRPISKSCDHLAWLLLAAVGGIAILTFRDYGLGWDDYTHSEYADLLIALYRSGFRDTRALSFANLYMYGGGFDVLAAFVQKILPLGIFEARRLTGAAVGILGLALTWRLARRAGGPVAGLGALMVLALCPTYYGHVFMNPKDAPFAVAMVLLLLALVRVAEEYPSPSPRTVLMVGTGAGLALGMRVLGGLALIYALVALVPLLLAEIRTQGWRGAAQRLGGLAYALLPGLVFGYLVMGLVWPWAILDPLNPIKAIGYFAQFFEKPWKEMFDGALVAVPDMPWSYLPTLFVRQLPEITLGLVAVGTLGALASQARGDTPATRRAVLLLIVTAALLPIAIAMIKRPALYNGVRHFVFLTPPLAVLAGLAFHWILAPARRYGRAPAFAAAAVIFAGLALPLIDMVRLHPYQYTHFNRLSGSVRAANDRFMLDYWGLAFKQASDDLHALITERHLAPPPGRSWKVAVCGPQRPAQVALGPGFTIGWDSKGADFAMMLDEFYCQRLAAPVVVEVMRDDVVFARVYDIRGRDIPSLLTLPEPK